MALFLMLMSIYCTLYGYTYLIKRLYNYVVKCNVLVIS